MISDRVAETSTTTGTGAFTLAGALTGYVRFDDMFSTGIDLNYLIEAVDADGAPTGAWETGMGTYSATDTLTRTTVHASSNAGAAVNFGAGTKRVHLSATADALGHKGAMVKRTTDQTGANYTAATAISWEAEQYDTSTFWVIDDPTRLTINSGKIASGAYARVTAQINLANVTASEVITAYIDLNGATTALGLPRVVIAAPSTTPSIQLVSAPILVNPSDDFRVMLQTAADTSIDVKNTSWAEISITGLLRE